MIRVKILDGHPWHGYTGYLLGRHARNLRRGPEDRLAIQTGGGTYEVYATPDEWIEIDDE